MEKEEKKEISSKTTVKAIITGYIAYGILFAFIMFVLGVAVNWALGLLPNANSFLVRSSLLIFCGLRLTI